MSYRPLWLWVIDVIKASQIFQLLYVSFISSSPCRYRPTGWDSNPSLLWKRDGRIHSHFSHFSLLSYKNSSMFFLLGNVFQMQISSSWCVRNYRYFYCFVTIARRKASEVPKDRQEQRERSFVCARCTCMFLIGGLRSRFAWLFPLVSAVLCLSFAAFCCFNALCARYLLPFCPLACVPCYVIVCQ